MAQIIGFLALGLFAGIISGLIGIGGGIVIVPTLVFLFHFSQHRAQGTTLALLVPPIGILAAWAYYRQDNEVLRRGVVDLGADHHFLVHETEVHGVQPIVGPGLALERDAGKSFWRSPAPDRAEDDPVEIRGWREASPCLSPMFTRLRSR